MLNRLRVLIGIAACGAGVVATPVAAHLPAAVVLVPMTRPLILTHTSAWSSAGEPVTTLYEAMRDALEAEPDLVEWPAASLPVASGYGSGHPLPSVATAYRYAWDAEFDRVRELVRELASSAPEIAGCSNVRVVNWRGESSDITPCKRSPGN